MNDLDAKRCYLCGGENADSVDHIPPKNLFLKKYRNKGVELITVPAHEKCNQKFQKNDDYFRFSLLIPSYWESEMAKELWDAKIVKQVHRPESKGFKAYVLDNLVPVDVSTPSGIFLGRAEAELIDANRMINVIERIARGIYYKNTGMILPLVLPVEVEWMRPDIRNQRRKLEQNGKFISFGNGIFKYLWKHVENDDKLGFFWFVFFDCVDFWVFTGGEK